MALSVKLQRLLMKANLWGHGRYCLTLWFDGCELEKTALLCPNVEHKAFIDRNFLGSLRQAVPDLAVMVAEAEKKRPSLLRPPIAEDQDLFR